MWELEERLQALESRLNIIELEAAYARSFDEHDGDTWSSLFTADGIYQSRPIGEAAPVTFVQGTAALRSYCTDAPFGGIHLPHLPQISLSGDRATARVHLEFHGDWPAEPGQPRLHMIGYYDVSYLRIDGRWLIDHRITTAYSREQRTLLGYAPAAVLRSGI